MRTAKYDYVIVLTEERQLRGPDQALDRQRIVPFQRDEGKMLAERLQQATSDKGKATPPAGTTPSSTAARVACSASSTRAFFSFISISVPGKPCSVSSSGSLPMGLFAREFAS